MIRFGLQHPRMKTRPSLFIGVSLALYLGLAHSMIIPSPRDDVSGVDNIERSSPATASSFMARDRTNSQFFHTTILEKLWTEYVLSNDHTQLILIPVTLGRRFGSIDSIFSKYRDCHHNSPMLADTQRNSGLVPGLG